MRVIPRLRPAAFLLALLCLFALLCGACGDDTLPRFARPPRTDAGPDDAGLDSGEQPVRDAAEASVDPDAGSS